MTIELGKPIPHFSGKTHDGIIDSQSLRGKNIVIYFYPKDNTPGCTIEAKTFRDHYAEFRAKETEIIGISRDNLQSHCKFSDKYELTFPLISDDDEVICNLFGVLKPKSMFGKKYMGIERSTFLIDKNGILRAQWRNVSVFGHVASILEVVKTL